MEGVLDGRSLIWNTIERRNAMKESDVMQGLSAKQQAEILVNSIMKEIEKLNALPAEEAKRVALTNLFDAGIIDEDGNYSAPYVALGKWIEFIPNDAKSEDDILEFLYGTLAYNQHKEYFEKYIDMNNVEDGEKIRKELSAMSGAGDLLVNDTIKANSMEIAKGLIALGKNTLEEIASVTRLPLDVIKNLAKPKAQQQ